MKVIDLLGNPIYRALYEVKDQKTGKVIAKGGTTIKGDIVPISRDKGTILDIYIRNMFTMDFKKLGSVTLNKDRMVATIRSPKIMIDALTTLYEGATQTYKRKTYKVKTGDTLGKIAKENGATVRALAQLNDLKDENKLSVGQVIKLPVAILATGNHNYEEKPKTQEQPRAENKPKNSTKVEQPVVKQPTPVSATEAHKKAEEWQKQKIEQANQAKKIPVQTTPNRSEATGTPKTDVANPCQTQPQCIASGSGELIREINIRLAGFGGALPTDQFTDLTANCIKQFQRDYMGVAETGKICGSLLVALDKFSMEFNEDIFTLPKHKVKCPCKKCEGYGNTRNESYSVLVKDKKTKKLVTVTAKGIEYPGIHRSLLWAYKAINFYFKETTNFEGYYIHHIESGYRCIENNIQHHRASSNHMGCAIDFHVYNKAGRKIIGTEIEEIIRKKWLMKNQKAWFGWTNNKFGLERNCDGSDSWIHIDVREYDKKYKLDQMFAKNNSELNGKSLVAYTKEMNLEKLLQCSGLSSIKEHIKESTEVLSDLDSLIADLGTAISHGEGGYESYNTGTINNKVQYSYLKPAQGTLTEKTLKEILNSHTLPATDKNRYFAVGKYQLIPSTLNDAINKLQLSLDLKFDAKLQERIFKDYLAPQKRAILGSFIKEGNHSIDVVQYEMAKEWASIAVPQGMNISKKLGGYASDGQKSFYESSANHANLASTKKVRDILTKISQYHQGKK